MLIIDIILFIIILGFFINGWQAGLIRMAAGLLGIILGVIIAGNYYGLLYDLLIRSDYFVIHENLAKVISLIGVFLIVNGVIGVGAYFVDRVFHIFAFIPFLKTINHLLGAILGLIIGIMLMGFIATILINFPLTSFITRYFENSYVIPYLLAIWAVINPLLPEATRFVKETLKI